MGAYLLNEGHAFPRFREVLHGWKILSENSQELMVLLRLYKAVCIMYKISWIRGHQKQEWRCGRFNSGKEMQTMTLIYINIFYAFLMVINRDVQSVHIRWVLKSFNIVASLIWKSRFDQSLYEEKKSLQYLID
jgi:hypothetical protein